MRIARGISIANTSKPISTASAFDADAVAFFTAASITDATQKSAVNTLVISLKSSNIWTKMKALYPVVGGVASAHAVNLKQPGTFNLTFATGWTHSNTGMTPNGATYADTFFICDNNLTYGSVSISFYSRTNTIGNYSDIGSYGLPINNYKSYTLQCRNTGDLARSGIYDGNGTVDWATFFTLDSRGFFIANRQSTTNNRLIKNGILGNINNININYSTYINPYPSYIGATNNNGAIQFSNRECAFASIGNGLTDAEASSFYTAVQTYQTTLGRQV